MGTIARSTRLMLCVALGGSAATVRAEPPRLPAPFAQAAGNAQTIPALLEEVGKLGERLARANEPVEIVSLCLRQSDVLVQLLAAVKPEERETWVRQLADCLQMAATYSPPQDRVALGRLVDLRNQLACLHPGSKMTAYVAYREVQAAGAVELSGSNGDNKQGLEQWRLRLAGFVQSYPRADDTPDALLELADVDKVLNHDQEIRQCYHKVVEGFPNTPQAFKADGALKRLDLVGRPLSLTLPLLFVENERNDEPFDLEALHGRTVVVYCWAGSTPQVGQDFAKLKALRQRYLPSGVELVCVSLNDSPKAAKQCLGGRDVPGVHVFQRGGVKGTWAQRHGIQDVPFVLVVGKEGHVLSQGLGVSDLDTELAKQTNK